MAAPETGRETGPEYLLTTDENKVGMKRILTLFIVKQRRIKVESVVVFTIFIFY